MLAPSRFPSQQATPPVRRPRRSPRPKLSIPSASLAAAAESPLPTRASETVDEDASGKSTSAYQMPPQLDSRASVAPMSSGGVGSAAGAAGTTSTAATQGNERETNPPADAAGPGAPPHDTGSPPGTVSRGINSQDGDSNKAAALECRPAAAAGAATDGEDSGSRLSQSSAAPVGAPAQDTVPAGLLWSDFGGGREAGEDAEETASREFAEESFGMFHGVRLESDSVARSQVSPCRRRLIVLPCVLPQHGF